MTLHACIVGIDGSGKTSTSQRLAEALAARHGLVAASAGERFAVATPASPTLAVPGDLPMSAALAAKAKRAAKRLVNVPLLYPPFKLAQMLLQDSAAWRLGRAAHADVVVSDGNLLLSAAGRAGNYRRAASRGRAASRPSPEPGDLAALFACLAEGEPLPPASRAKLPPVGLLRAPFALLRRLGLRPAWLPDVVVFLDLAPEAALARIAARGAPVDAHENVEDLAQARSGYLRALEAFRACRGGGSVLVLETEGMTLEAAAVRASAWIAASRSRAGADPAARA